MNNLNGQTSTLHHTFCSNWERLFEKMTERGWKVSIECDMLFALATNPAYREVAFSFWPDELASKGVKELQSSTFLQDLDPMDFEGDHGA